MTRREQDAYFAHCARCKTVRNMADDIVASVEDIDLTWVVDLRTWEEPSGRHALMWWLDAPQSFYDIMRSWIDPMQQFTLRLRSKFGGIERAARGPIVYPQRTGNVRPNEGIRFVAATIIDA